MHLHATMVLLRIRLLGPTFPESLIARLILLLEVEIRWWSRAQKHDYPVFKEISLGERSVPVPF